MPAQAPHILAHAPILMPGNPPSGQDHPAGDSAAPEFHHIPVLLDAVLGFVPPEARLLVDATLGGAGHALAMLEAHPQVHLLGCDRDPDAIQAAQYRLAAHGGRVMVRQCPFSQLPHHVLSGSVDFLLADLGVSSHQLGSRERGFLFGSDGPLLMTMDGPDASETAASLLARLGESALVRILRDYGEERHAMRIARAIVRAREEAPLETTVQLSRIIFNAVPAAYRHGRIHPATRTFQALRIAVNDELGELDRLLAAIPPLMAPGGRVALISFHSLEDRRVKNTFRDWESPCTCPPAMPACICGATPLGIRLTRKAERPGPEEIARNPRSRSARLRVFQMAGGQP